MATETFDDFMVHSRKCLHSTSGGSITLGNGYSMSIKPNAPELLQWELKFTGYKWYLKDVEDPDTHLWSTQIDLETKKSVNNFGWLMDFYRRHELWDPFIYNDPVYGEKLVRFNAIIDEPEVYANSNGVVEPFTVKLIEVSQ